MLPTAINWSDCVQHSNNQPDLAQELLDLLTVELPTLKHDIQQSHQNQDRAQLAHVIHKLHGAACYCGTQHLKGLLQALEPNIQQLPDAELNARVQAVLAEINRVQQSLANRDYR